MAGQALRRDATGRFCSAGETGDGTPNPLRFPTQRHPRFRLVVYDKRWPWRATRGEALRDAVASRHARHDCDDRATYLMGYAEVQRDPPLPRWAMRP